MNTLNDKELASRNRKRVGVSWVGRVFRFLIFVAAVVAFVAAVFYGSLRSQKMRPYAMEASSRVEKALNVLVGDADGKTQLANLFASTEPAAKEMDDTSLFVTTVATIDATPSDSSLISRKFTGVIVPCQSSDLGFKRIGRLVTLTVDHGDSVTKGDVIASLDTKSLNASRRVLRAELRAANARLAELEAGPRSQTIAAARAKLNEFKAMVDLGSVTSNRQRRLAESNAGSRQQFDNARLQLAASRSRYEAQLKIIEELEAGTRKEQLEAQRAVVEKLDASISSLDVDIEDSELKAPFDAIVSKRMVDEGVVVSPGTVILRLVRQSSPEAWIGIPLKVASDLKIGDAYDLLIENKPTVGRLKSILPELDSMTRTQTAVFEVEDANNIRFGQTARFEWQQEKKLEGYWLPTTSLAHGMRGLWAVFVAVADETVVDDANNAESEEPTSKKMKYVLERRDVEVLQIESTRVLVRGTIKAGDKVISSGIQKLTPGQQVEISQGESSLTSIH